MSPMVTDDEEGKKVVQGTETIGRVVEVKHGTAYIDLDPGVTDTIKSKLGWGDRDEDTYPLQEESISEITDDEIRLETKL